MPLRPNSESMFNRRDEQRTIDGRTYFVPSGSIVTSGKEAGGTKASFGITCSVISASAGLMQSSSNDSGSWFSFKHNNGKTHYICFTSNSMDGIKKDPPYGIPFDTIANTYHSCSFTPNENSTTKFNTKFYNNLTQSFITIYSESKGISPASFSLTDTDKIEVFITATGSNRINWNPVLTSSFGWSFNWINSGSGTNDGSGSRENQFLPDSTLRDSSSYAIGFETGTDNFVISGSGTNKFYMSSSGLIGINTTDPKRAFDVRDESAGAAEFAIKKNPKGSEETRGWLAGDEVGNLLFIADSSSFASEVSGAATRIKSYIGSIDAGGVSGRMDFLSYKGVDPTPLTLMQMGYGAVASHAGNSGINIEANISQALASTYNVSNVLVPTFFDGSITASGDISSSGAESTFGETLKVVGEDPRLKLYADAGDHPGFELYDGTTRKWIIYNDPDDSHNLNIKDDGDDRVSITQAGKVGIGKTAPTKELEVVGDISASGEFYGNNIGEVYDNHIYLTPADFYASNRYDYSRDGKGFIDDDGANLEDASRDKYYAMKVIPKGYKATHAYVHSNNPAGDTYDVFSSSYDVTTAADAIGSHPNTNTVATFSNDITGGGGIYAIVSYVPSAANKKLYGGYILLAKA